MKQKGYGMKKLFLIIVLAFNLHASNNQENLKIFKNFLNQLGDTFGYKVGYKNAKCVDAHEVDDGSSECTATNFTLTDKNGNIFLEDGYVDSSVDSKYFIETIIRDFKKPIYGRFNDIHIILNLISGEFFIHLDSWRISFKVSYKTTEAYHNKNGKTIPIYGDKNIKYLYVLSGKISLSLSPYYLEKLDIDELYEKILSNFGKASLYREDRIVLKNDLKEFKELKRNKFTIAFEYFPGGSLYKIIQDFKNGEAFGRGVNSFKIIKDLNIDTSGRN